ncbi:MAG: hypothetical protein RLZZ303_1528 [Candidatus Hydrogenedentota bacterium]
MTPRRIILALATAIAVAYLGICLVFYLIQDRLIFPGTKEMRRDPSYYGWDFEEVWLEPLPGEKSLAWFVPVENARGVCLFSHGNGGNISTRLESIGIFRNLGLSVLAYDYGGYGKSSGKTSEQRVYADVRAAWKHLTETRGLPPEKILLFGRSMGGAPTTQLATEVKPAAVVLESAYTSLPAVAQEVVPLLPARFITKYRFDNLSKIGAVQVPLLVIHSPDDTLVRYHHGQQLYAAANEPKTFLEIHGDHSGGFVQSMDIYLPAWEKFLDGVLPKE